MEEFGIDVPLFTSDGAWEEVLDVGTLIEEDVFVTGNFGSHSKENATVMKAFMAKHDKSTDYVHGILGRLVQSLGRTDLA